MKLGKKTDNEEQMSRGGRYRMKPTTGKEKLGYFMDYYFVYVIIGVVVLALTAFILYTTVFNRKETAISLALVTNEPVDTERMSQNIRDYLGIEEDNKTVDISVMPPGDYQMKMALMAWIGTREVDLILADRETFDGYISAGYFCDLQKTLPGDVYDSLGDTIIEGAIADIDDEGNKTVLEEEKSYGGYFAYDVASAKFNPGGEFLGLGIVVNSKRPDAAVKVFEYFAR